MTGEVLRVWLIEGSSEETLFLADVRSMLEAIARRVGCNFSSSQSIFASDDPPLEFRTQVQGHVPGELLREVGVHRAQRIPRASTTGRIETVLVGVEILPPDRASTAGQPNERVLKTYNYIERWVLCHESGEKLSLDAVLGDKAC